MDIITYDASYSLVKGPDAALNAIRAKYKAERQGAMFDPLVKRGFKSAYNYFTTVTPQGLLMMNGHCIQEGLLKPEPLNISTKLPDGLPFAPYDFQVRALKECVASSRCLIKMCTGSGKSLVIALLCNALVNAGMRGLLLVPNINLLEQFKSDIESYNLTKLVDSVELYGGGSKPTFNKQLLISTWQSLQNVDKEQMPEFDFLVADECHRYSSDVTSSIIQNLRKTKFRWGFTGTIPDSASAAMMLEGLFGECKTVISSKQLIDAGLGTPIVINTLWMNYNDATKRLLRSQYQSALKALKEYEPRNNIIENLAIRLMNRQQNTLVLYSHTAHGKTLFTNIVKKLYPDIDLSPSDITGPKSFNKQQELGVYFINGEDDANTREVTRQALASAQGAILVSNYSVLGTGINIKSLHNLIMASPLKSYTTITQSIGRGIRLHETKDKFNVYDIVDNTNLRGVGGVFVRQYKERLTKSYSPEGYIINESTVNI